MLKISILGSTGSIGTQALDVIDKLNLEIKVNSLAVYRNIQLLENQIRHYRPHYVAVFDLNAAKDLKVKTRDLDVEILQGDYGVEYLAASEENNIVLNAVTGVAGLKPSIATLKAGKKLALANKETMVTGGELINKIKQSYKAEIIPVDSEHSAIFQCLRASDSNHLKRIILTASGGPFWGLKTKDLVNVTPAQALINPNWKMGNRVTIDSSTLFNKGMEVIEAKWLFNVSTDMIDVIIQRESIIHSAVEFEDNAIIAQLGIPDMRIPIQYAFTYPKRMISPVNSLDLAEISKLTFYRPDTETFRCLDLCKEALKKGGLYTAAINGADEEAVKLFISGKIRYTEISEIIEKLIVTQDYKGEVTYDNIMEADKEARSFVFSMM
jgi:1-deoxy-D-xylulose-5-phosphate reductoisomerase